MNNIARQLESREGDSGRGPMSRNSEQTVRTEGRENPSRAFEAWLESYRTRLEQACGSADKPQEP